MQDDDENLAAALSTLLSFLADEPLTARIANLEHTLDGIVMNDVSGVLDAHAVNIDLLRSALLVRDRLGRIDDLIHATAIALALPHLLAPGEILRRPSLASGNDPSRPFDLETDRRVAEFKLAQWKGADPARKRQAFKDLVHLAADQSGRVAELYVLGQRPIQFLRESRSSVTWALDRSSATSRALFTERFGSLEMPVAEFVAGPGSRVAIIDLEQRLPDLFAPLP